MHWPSHAQLSPNHPPVALHPAKPKSAPRVLGVGQRGAPPRPTSGSRTAPKGHSCAEELRSTHGLSEFSIAVAGHRSQSAQIPFQTAECIVSGSEGGPAARAAVSIYPLNPLRPKASLSRRWKG